MPVTPPVHQADCSATSGAGSMSVDAREAQGALERNLGTPYTVALSATALPAAEKFATVVAPRDGQVVRGVSFTPGTK